MFAGCAALLRAGDWFLVTATRCTPLLHDPSESSSCSFSSSSSKFGQKGIEEEENEEEQKLLGSQRGRAWQSRNQSRDFSTAAGCRPENPRSLRASWKMGEWYRRLGNTLDTLRRCC